MLLYCEPELSLTSRWFDGAVFAVLMCIVERPENGIRRGHKRDKNTLHNILNDWMEFSEQSDNFSGITISMMNQ